MKKLLKVSLLTTEMTKKGIILSEAVKKEFLNNYVDAFSAYDGKDHIQTIVEKTIQELYNNDVVKFSQEQEDTICYLHNIVYGLYIIELNANNNKKVFDLLQDGFDVTALCAETIELQKGNEIITISEKQ